MKILILCSLIFLFSCSHKSKKLDQDQSTTYSSDTEKEFESIENERARILEYYRELRKRNWNNYAKKSIRNKNKRNRYMRVVPRSYKAAKTPKRRRIKKVAPSPKPQPVTPWPDNKIKEVQIEIAQYLTFYCMEQRKNPRYKAEGSCKQYTNNLYDKCYTKHSPIRSRRIISCIKKGI